MKIMLVKSVEYNNEMVVEDSEYYHDKTEYIIMSDILDVEFTPLSHEIIVKQEVEMLNAQIKKVQVNAVTAVTDLNRRINELLALPSSVEK